MHLLEVSAHERVLFTGYSLATCRLLSAALSLWVVTSIIKKNERGRRSSMHGLPLPRETLLRSRSPAPYHRSVGNDLFMVCVCVLGGLPKTTGDQSPGPDRAHDLVLNKLVGNSRQDRMEPARSRPNAVMLQSCYIRIARAHIGDISHCNGFPWFVSQLDRVHPRFAFVR